MAGLVGGAIGLLIAVVPKAKKHLDILMNEGPGFEVPAPIVTLLLALALAGLIDLALRSNLPLVRGLRTRVRTNLTPSLWFSAEEIAHRAGVSRWLVQTLSAGIKSPVVGALHVMARLKVAVTALSGSSIALFFALPEFKSGVIHNFTVSNLVINSIATIFMTFFLGPLHERVVRLSREHDPPSVRPSPAPAEDSARTWPRLLKLGLIFLLLYALQVLHSATHDTLVHISAFQAIMLLEFCVLPVVVTSYYLVAALHRQDLGGRQWDRAFGACIWAGTIVLLPFALVAVATIDPPFLLFKQVLAKPTVGGVAMLVGASLLLLVLGSMLSVVVAVATYGVFSLALALALSVATRANGRLRAALAIIAAGAFVQIVVAAAAALKLIPRFEGIDRAVYYYVPLTLALGWAAGVFVSRFEERLPAPAEMKAETAR